MFRNFEPENHTRFNKESSVLSNPKFDRSLHLDLTNFGFGALARHGQPMRRAPYGRQRSQLSGFTLRRNGTSLPPASMPFVRT